MVKLRWILHFVTLVVVMKRASAWNVGTSSIHLSGAFRKVALSMPTQETRTRPNLCARWTHMSSTAPVASGLSTQASVLSLFSPAKTNIFLRITRKRDDGFHELASVFQALGLGDTLKFTPLDSTSSNDILTCNVAEVPTDERNLVAKAFNIFRKKTGVQQFFHCDIDKRTPLEGGMGGGSSNAATALWAANRLCGSPASDQMLIDWGGELGRRAHSDVGFFLSGGTAYCTGRGEIVETIRPGLRTPPGSFWVVKPPEGCPTPAVYRNLGLQPGQELPGPDPVALRDKLMKEGLSPSVCINDLEPPAHAVLPRLRGIRDALVAGGFDTVLLSGSGATTFALDKTRAVDLGPLCDNRHGWLCKSGLNNPKLQRRYCAIYAGRLYYFVGPRSEEANGTVLLHGAVVQPYDRIPCGFVIHTSELSTSSADERRSYYFTPFGADENKANTQMTTAEKMNMKKMRDKWIEWIQNEVAVGLLKEEMDRSKLQRIQMQLAEKR